MTLTTQRKTELLLNADNGLSIAGSSACFSSTSETEVFHGQEEPRPEALQSGRRAG